MKLITVRTQIRSLSDRWKAQFQKPDGTWLVPKERKIYEALCALDVETASLEDVRTALGFDGGWLEVPKCDECKQEVGAIVLLGDDDPDIEGYTAQICSSCLQKALELL